MKKLISSTISFMTSFALLICGVSGAAFAEEGAAAEFDPAASEMCIGDIDFSSLDMPGYPKVQSNLGSGFYNYGDNLDANNLAVYNAMKTLTVPTTEAVTVKLPETITLKLSALPTSDRFTDDDMEKYQQAVFGACKPGIDAVLFDFPEIYWIEPSGMSVALGTDTGQTRTFSGYTLKIRSLVITPSYLQGFRSLEEAKSYGALLEEGLDKVDISGETRYEKLKSIHDYIAKFTYYDLEAKFSSSALGAVVEPGVVCEGYSEAFKLMCDRLDIPCVCVFGNLNVEENAGHMWNYVQMEDGIWYAVDVTWDDLDGDGGRELKYEYFLKGSKSFYVKHTPVSDYNITQLEYPPLSEKDYVFKAGSDTPVTTVTTTTVTTTTKKTTTTTKAKTTTTTKPKTTTTTKPKTTTTTKPVTTTTTTTTTEAATTTTTTAETTTTTVTETTTAATTTTTAITTTITTTTTAPEPLVGDLNRDGEVNIADLVYCQAAILGKLKPDNSCDANGDGVADAFDLIFMRKLLIEIA